MAEENQHTKPSQEQPSELTPILPRSYGQLLGLNSVRKMEWPELVGLTAEEAESKIKEEMPWAQIQVVQPNCFVTMDFNLQRVRLYVDSTGKIERPPRTG